MSNKFKTIIVDDERLARNELRNMLSSFDRIKIIAEAENVIEAVELIEKHKPDVIFLDIQMPGESGFDFVNKINTKAKIIFVTAFNEFALRAFEVNALDYLLKPINPERLKSAIERLDDTAPDSAEKHDLSFDDRLFISINNEMKFIKIEDINCIIAAGDYSEINLNNGQKGLVLKSMREWETRLPGKYFCRIHRSTIINMEYVEKIEEWFNHSFRIYIKGIKEPLVMSRRYASKLKEKFR